MSNCICGAGNVAFYNTDRILFGILGKRQDELVELLLQEEDFKTSLTSLEENFQSDGRAHFLFLPKFHPELNPIESAYR